MYHKTLTSALSSACLASLLSLFIAVAPINAKDIKLGGEKKTETLPPNVVAMPSIAVAIRTDDGGWKHIKIDCWLVSKDIRTSKAIEVLRNSIAGKADRELPNHSFETLLSPELGSVEAKKAIRTAVEASLGREYTGEVLIRNMLVY
jgi:hypothetical protein